MWGLVGPNEVPKRRLPYVSVFRTNLKDVFCYHICVHPPSRTPLSLFKGGIAALIKRDKMNPKCYQYIFCIFLYQLMWKIISFKNYGLWLSASLCNFRKNCKPSKLHQTRKIAPVPPHFNHRDFILLFMNHGSNYNDYPMDFEAMWALFACFVLPYCSSFDKAIN